MRYYFIGGLLLLAAGLMAQTPAFYQDAEGQLLLRPSVVANLLEDLPTIDHSAPAPTTHQLSLPTPDGDIQTFFIWKTNVAEPALSTRFPGIVTLGGMAKDKPSIKLRAEWKNDNARVAPNADGKLSLMIFDPAERWVIRPLVGTDSYEMGTETDFAHLRRAFECMVDDHDGFHDHEENQQSPVSAPYPIGEELRSYRMAVATTAAYTNFHGPGNDTASVLAAVLASVNRISEVYESDVSVTFTLVEETTKTFYFGDDPFSGSGPLGFLHDVIVDSIGLNNFDVGHLFDVGGGGVASLGSVCTSNRKGSGYTSLNPPEGDPFDIDYLAHEVGHQFAGNHTFNSCNPSQGPQPFEPGSGVTIMAYAGICGVDNVANRSIPQFHAASLAEITQFTQFGTGNSCPTTTATNNTPPTTEAVVPGNIIIPPDTPFELEATSTDDETPEAVTYSWEQYQTGPSVPLGDAAGSSPLFRNFNHTTNPVRVFPRMQRILSGVDDRAELLPTYDRNVRFRIVARDNSSGGGGVFWNNFDIIARAAGGPFRVTSQGEGNAELTAGDVAILTWERGNTHQAPFSTDSIDVYLGADPLNGFDQYLGRVENTGSAFVVIPEIAEASTYRFKLKGVDRLWFNINEEDINLVSPDGPALSVTNLESDLSLCGTGTLEINFFVSRLNGADGEIDFEVIGLPAEVQTEITETDLLPGRSYLLTLTIGNDVPNGDYQASIVATAGEVSDMTDFRALLQVEALAAPANLVPVDSEVEVSVSGPFEWEEATSDDITFDIQITTDATNDNWEIEEFGLTENSFVPSANLDEQTAYFWRVRSNSPDCGSGPWSPVQSFTTESLVCLTFNSEDTPVEMGGSISIISTIEVEQDYPVRSLRVTNATGIYQNFGELRFLLLTPDAGAFTLTETTNCQTNNFNLGFSDDGATLVCSQVNTGNLFRPIESFSDARNSSSEGNWRLRIFDQAIEGELSSWQLELCVPERLVSTRNAPLAQTAVRVFPNPGNNVLNFRWSELPVNPQLVILSDINGREMVRLQGSQPRQSHQITVDANGLPNGMYIYRMLTEDGQLIASGRWVKQ
ncbi:MAG: reprolysin-like metallopeptidase [Bacteroidota bacterium]